jgi:hypothetical protein
MKIEKRKLENLLFTPSLKIGRVKREFCNIYVGGQICKYNIIYITFLFLFLFFYFLLMYLIVFSCRGSE